MPSVLHEALVDAIRYNAARFFAIDGFQATIADAAIFNALHDCKHLGWIADCYFLLSEGVIVLEVGDMHDGKWRGICDPCGTQIRVLRIGKDRSVSLIHARHTVQETAFVQAVAMTLTEIGEDIRAIGPGEAQ